MIDFTTDTSSTDYETMDTHQNRIGTQAVKMVTLMPTSHLTRLPSKSPSNKMQIGLIAMKILVVTVFILLLTFILLLIVRRYFNARKWNSSGATLNTHSIKYISDKQLNKIHIDMNAENAQNCEKINSEPGQRHNCEFENQIDANDDENEQNKGKTKMFDRVKKQLCRPTLLAAAGRYRSLKETM